MTSNPFGSTALRVQRDVVAAVVLALLRAGFDVVAMVWQQWYRGFLAIDVRLGV